MQYSMARPRDVDIPKHYVVRRQNIGVEESMGLKFSSESATRLGDSLRRRGVSKRQLRNSGLMIGSYHQRYTIHRRAIHVMNGGWFVKTHCKCEGGFLQPFDKAIFISINQMMTHSDVAPEAPSASSSEDLYGLSARLQAAFFFKFAYSSFHIISISYI